jgi:dTDP-4-amino-4,6-dideoxygalactose transaminase
MNELQAAYGILQLKYIDKHIAKRKEITNKYREKLNGIPGIRVLYDIDSIKHAYSYFPILIDAQKYGRTRDDIYEEFKKYNIFSRRYFYPLISQFPTYQGLPSARSENLPVAESVAKKVLCLPIYPDLDCDEVDLICDIIRDFR